MAGRVEEGRGREGSGGRVGEGRVGEGGSAPQLSIREICVGALGALRFWGAALPHRPRAIPPVSTDRGPSIYIYILHMYTYIYPINRSSY